jgi:hypothetical protein
MSVYKNPLLAGLLFVQIACKQSQHDSSTQFALSTGPGRGSLLETLLEGKKVIHVCLINENPSLNSNWLDRVELAFKNSFQSWMAEGTQHPVYPLPKDVHLKFFKIPAAALLQREAESNRRLNADPSTASLQQRLMALMNASDANFKSLFNEFTSFLKALELKNNAPLVGCPGPAVTVETFSETEAIIQHAAALEQASKAFTPPISKKQEEELLKKFVRIMFGGKLSFEEYRRKKDLSKKNQDHLFRAHAFFSPPKIVIQKTPTQEQLLDSIMTHEMGHLFGLGDVYIDRDLQTDLKAHPDAIMGDHNSPSVNGKIQPDDVKGLFAAITFAKTKVKSCGPGYKVFENLGDARSVHAQYCLPDGFEEHHVSDPRPDVKKTPIDIRLPEDTQR